MDDDQHNKTLSSKKSTAIQTIATPIDGDDANGDEDNSKSATHMNTRLDYRPLIQHSKRAQIEKNLCKLQQKLTAIKTAFSQDKSLVSETIAEHNFKNDDDEEWTCCHHSHCSHCRHHHHQLTSHDEAMHGWNQSLLNIEDDLHKVLYIVLRQYEWFQKEFPSIATATGRKTVRIADDEIINNKEIKAEQKDTLRVELPSTTKKPNISKESKKSITEKETIHFDQDKKECNLGQRPTTSPLPSKDLGTFSLFPRSRPQFPAPPLPQVLSNKNLNRRTKSCDIVRTKQSTSTSSSINNKVLTKFEKPLHTATTTGANDYSEAQQYYSHYRITKPDVHWILGTATNPSHSLTARAQIKLSQLKQHGPLCCRIRDLTNVSTKALNGNQLIKLHQLPRLSPSKKIVEQIRNLICELHQEHDQLYRKLRWKQTLSGESDTIGSGQSEEMLLLSNHLIHITNHLYDLHRLEKLFICQ